MAAGLVRAAPAPAEPWARCWVPPVRMRGRPPLARGEACGVPGHCWDPAAKGAVLASGAEMMVDGYEAGVSGGKERCQWGRS